eukprot:7491104-Lingulodinium_polyedra.AAC.1
MTDSHSVFCTLPASFAKTDVFYVLEHPRGPGGACPSLWVTTLPRQSLVETRGHLVLFRPVQ